MATASKPARSPRASRNAAAPSRQHPSRAVSPLLDQTVRYPPPDALRLFASGEARDAFLFTAIPRQIAASRVPHSAPASQSSSFVALSPSQTCSYAYVAGRATPRSHRPSPSPTRTHSSRSSPHAEPVKEVLLQKLAHFADQLAAQSAAQSAAQLSALSAVMQSFDTLHPARPPSQTASPTSPHATHHQSALNVLATAGVSLSSCFQSLACPLALHHRVAAHVSLGATQQSHQLALTSLAPLAFASPAPPALTMSFASPAHLAPFANRTASPQSGLHLAPFANRVASPQSGLLLAPLTVPPLSSLSSVTQLPSHLQYLQSAPRVASTVVAPTVPQPGPTSALHAVASLAATQPVTYPPFASLQFGAVEAKRASQVGASQAMGAQVACEEVQSVVCTQPAFLAKAPLVMCA